MNKVNYQKEMEKILLQIVRDPIGSPARQSSEHAAGAKKDTGEKQSPVPTLLLHSCCAPCSSYVLKYLREFFKITVFYYNPNISEQAEYRKRVLEQKRLIAIYNDGVTLPPGYPIDVVEGDYEPEAFFDMARDYKDCPEGGERCFLCYELRLKKTAERAVEGGFSFFGTTLTISPLKNAEKLNEIGFRLQEELGVRWLPSDFKKKEGYKQSIVLSGEYGLYRQDYCGCVYSRLEREQARKLKNR